MFVGDSKFFLVGVDQRDYAFAFFQAMFATVAGSITSGAMLERTRPEANFAFNAVMAAIIYPPVAHWVKNPNGFFYKLEVTDVCAHRLL
jgi:Amt family ammonium transporter